MRSFGLVERKLEEADFFLERVSNAGWGEISYYFSAFVSASRSITFAIQGAISDIEGFNDWYATWQKKLKENQTAKFFHECRTDSQHLGICPIVGGAGYNGNQKFFFGQPSGGRFKYIPTEDVVLCCRSQMEITCYLLNDCYTEFGLIIDPNQIYTLEGLAQVGWTIEDVEEELGFPRGWTDIEWPEADKDYQRLRLLRRNIPMSYAFRIMQKYIPESVIVSWPPDEKA